MEKSRKTFIPRIDMTKYSLVILDKGLVTESIVEIVNLGTTVSTVKTPKTNNKWGVMTNRLSEINQEGETN
jgi:preprotein translocase subunit Sec63